MTAVNSELGADLERPFQPPHRPALSLRDLPLRTPLHRILLRPLTAPTPFTRFSPRSAPCSAHICSDRKSEKTETSFQGMACCLPTRHTWLYAILISVCVVNVFLIKNNVEEITAVISVLSSHTFNYSRRTQSYCK